MAETETSSSNNNNNNNKNNIPIEIVSDEEMAFIEAAYASVTSSSSSIFARSLSSCCTSSTPSSSPRLHNNSLSINSITLLSKRKLSSSSSSSSSCGGGDIEDTLRFVNSRKKPSISDSFLRRFRKKRALSVTDLTSTEWCPKQMEFSLLLGGKKVNQFMKAGIARHAKLEAEVITRVEVKIQSQEDRWALKLLNFITGVNQLLFEGITRELPIIGFADGVWMIGVIDEVRMPLENDNNPILIDTKTRARDTLPSEPQRRNGRLQLMCYKYMWDNLVADNFPSKSFFNYFGLNPQSILSEDLKVLSADSGFSVLTLDDVVRYYRNTYTMLSPANDQLLLRYEYQKDHSLLCEDKFAYDSEWLKDQIHSCLEFWLGEREATYVQEDERWKCRFCQYAPVCPANTNSGEMSANTSNDSKAKED